MRLAAQAKMGYYPTPEQVTPIIARYLKRQRDGLSRSLSFATHRYSRMGSVIKI